LLQGS